MQNPLEEEVVGILEECLSPIIAQSILSLAVKRSGGNLNHLEKSHHEVLLKEIASGLELYSSDKPSQKHCMDRISQLIIEHCRHSPPEEPLPKTIRIEKEDDIVYAREMGREMCASSGFRFSAQIKLATAISELARNIVQYAGSGELRLSVVNENGRSGIEVVAEDHGPGIEDVDSILDGRYRSRTGLGRGLAGTKNLVDEFSIETNPMVGTRVVIRMYRG